MYVMYVMYVICVMYVIDDLVTLFFGTPCTTEPLSRYKCRGRVRTAVMEELKSSKEMPQFVQTNLKSETKSLIHKIKHFKTSI